MTEPDYLTPKEVAERLKISAPTVRNWCLDGTLNAVDIASPRAKARHWRIPREELDRFLAEGGNLTAWRRLRSIAKGPGGPLSGTRKAGAANSRQASPATSRSGSPSGKRSKSSAGYYWTMMGETPPTSPQSSAISGKRR